MFLILFPLREKHEENHRPAFHKVSQFNCYLKFRRLTRWLISCVIFLFFSSFVSGPGNQVQQQPALRNYGCHRLHCQRGGQQGQRAAAGKLRTEWWHLCDCRRLFAVKVKKQELKRRRLCHCNSWRTQLVFCDTSICVKAHFQIFPDVYMLCPGISCKDPASPVPLLIPMDTSVTLTSCSPHCEEETVAASGSI